MALAQVNQTERTLVETLGNQTALDAVIDPVQQPIAKALMQQPVLRNILDGSWLGHAVHPLLTDIPIGAWTAGCVLDLLDALGINRNLRQGADAVNAIGLAGALSAAVFGIADWSYTMDKPKRVGFTHGVLNVLVAGLYGGSLVARAKGNRFLGVALSSAGFDLLMVSGWLGGELSYRFGMGVDHTAFQEGPGEWVEVATEADLPEGKLHRVVAQETPVLLTRQGGQIYALADTCSHLGCSLAQGNVEGRMLVCPCHGSGFRVSDGQVLQGPATTPQPTFAVRVIGGRVAVRRAE